MRRVVLMVLMFGVAGGAAFGQVNIRIGDVTTLKGQSVNKLVGMGLVVGLNGTGDGDQYEAAMRQLAQAMNRLAAPVAGLEELKDTKNVAIVMVDAVIPEHGAREGDLIDVNVSSIGSAKSLAGGRLLITPLIYHDRHINTVYAFANGKVAVSSEDRATVGVIEDGAQMEEDYRIAFSALGNELPFKNEWINSADQYLTLVLEKSHASWGLAVAIAEAINAELSLAADVERVAMAVDPKNVVVWVPHFQRNDPASWIRDIQELSTLMPPNEARVVINRESGTIVVSGDARISPVAVSQRGLTVNVLEPPSETPEPRLISKQFVGVSTDESASTNVADLLTALNQLNVPVEDRIAILTQIQRAGKLHAKLMYED